ncbi:MAG: hypothetical protein ABW207_13090 [Stenotrophomonas chelatiphaga]
MTHFLKQIIATAALAFSAATHAASPAKDLEVQGTLRTPRCLVSADKDGIYDYGAMSLSSLPASGHVPLPPSKQVWTVTCSGAPTYVTYRINDAREGTASGAGTGSERVFGLGRMAERDASRIGFYEIWASNAKVAGATRLHGAYSPSRQNIYGAATNVVRPRTGNGYDEVVMTWSSQSGWAPLSAMQAGNQFSIDLEVRPFLASQSVVGAGGPVTEMVHLDGLATITFAFGL